MDDSIELICLIAIELDRRLIVLDKKKCGHETTLIDKHWSIPVVCNLIFGHVNPEHTNGLSKWRNDGT